MSQQSEFAVRVECYAGHRDELTPRRFSFGGRPIEVCEVLDAWLAPNTAISRYEATTAQATSCGTMW